MNSTIELFVFFCVFVVEKNEKYNIPYWYYVCSSKFTYNFEIIMIFYLLLVGISARFSFDFICFDQG